MNGAAAIRQPGSTLKPLLYGLCMDEGLLTPKQTIYDVAVNYRGYAPENFDRKIQWVRDHGICTRTFPKYSCGEELTGGWGRTG
ncbi:MAG: hypothetical protein WDM78_10770 [Puia sp.]